VIDIVKKIILLPIILITLPIIFSQNLVDIITIEPFPDQMYGGGTYSSEYLLRNNLGEEIPFKISWNVSDFLPIVGPEFSLSAIFDGMIMGCSQLKPDYFECNGYYKLLPNSEKILELILTVNPATMPSNYTFILGVRDGEYEHPPAKIELLERNLMVDGINTYDYRTGQYIFSGEQLYFKVKVTDYRGKEDIGFVKLLVDGRNEVLCSFTGDSGDTWKVFECLYTAEPDAYGEKEILIRGWDSHFIPFDSYHKENWFFNPGLSMDVTTSDNKGINFESGYPGGIVHSLNRLKVKNTAEGGVNLWMFLAGSDLYDPNTESKCPMTNKIDVEDWMLFRGWSGTVIGDWTQMSELDQNEDCDLSSCYNANPLPKNSPGGNVLTNQGNLEVEFKLEYPVPCIGSFSEGSIFVLAKTI